ncbi:PREDICTED: peptide deformylase 1A, chloroplastic/mitochondrial [Tarenaya hassleriana]|uniref:peptide deformylase 1A, chloroplastic/mitochondrial n=1 Tax=Tarenaya hassleriana TaxID=28532 RepID=UPI00053C4F4A|nr:PREDICTED: peptide deformylase 1A, chloroplastic/mitochondrial [Tarenaya hassleriana]
MPAKYHLVMETLPRFSLRLLPLSIAAAKFAVITHPTRLPVSRPGPFGHVACKPYSYSSSSSLKANAGWFLGLGDKKKMSLPDIVKAGDPVLHEQAREVDPGEIGSERIQKIIDDMVKVMRFAPGVGLAAPQIGIPLRIIVLEDTAEYISYQPKDDSSAQDRRPFDLMVIVNPKLKKKSDRTALFFEGCLSVDGFRAAVERHLDVEVMGYDREGKGITVSASGWQARILQHECDHLEGTLYVDKMVHRTFRTIENLGMPLAHGCPNLGAR